MHPAPSLILFTVLSGMGFGLLVWLGLGLRVPTGLAAFILFGLGYGLAGIGLIAAAFHLGHPERALKAFSQWRSSWLSREAVLAVASLLVMAPHAAASVFWDTPLPLLGWLGAVLALATIFATAMIYAQIRAVPRWHHWSTPPVFVLAALAGGALLAAQQTLALWLMLALGLAMIVHWVIGDQRFAQARSDTGTATGLGRFGRVRLLEPPHSGRNYLLREMVHVVGRKHAHKLRVIALGLGVVLPVIALLLPAGYVIVLIALLAHIAGMLAQRWLFFAEAEHVVGLYYGKR
ncbi:dimethyl sulfoxide reductase anchor subunit family protein [Roseinatronobacter bogoriensis]|uniref:Dibenzothiophene desulfurase n=1 Tax=Roseinatronobacter bogoriensis subsp. barguzinensis TaxID=441209 RepID=A0A2K8KD16_9RHOB|nr:MULTISPECIES: DmsC/YnfH family molybdoenzyme membrane anchor subunit [Rhodobaca]ATX67351.1 dibenzothiophene desulfurase [Rhodobaca barguzinensis]MBB4206921.1 DMSO reductase anchor subunit [Rhodobaca bogoriensis DSM 18756]TDW41664.1 DMSO reductase anchor subunit [Rhodobaca barguzinensis]TDY74157.1 DMSO reductase anchor subunit [Rhodobaca bogoriensis DSM 18756]